MSRLEQDFARLQQQVAQMPADIAVVKERIGAAVRRVNECMESQNDLEEYLRERDREQAKERKTDRHWLIGTALASATLVIMALGLLVDKV